MRWTTRNRIQLSDDQRSVIEQWARFIECTVRQVIRRIVLYAATRMENAEIATRLDSSVNS